MAFAGLRLNQVRVVVSADEHTAADAMRLGYRGGIESGFLLPNDSQMRFSPAYLNPGTEFVVAYADDEPIASLTLVEDGPFGLPADRAFVEELDAYRAAGDSLFEINAWVIEKQWRRFMAQIGALVFGTGMRLNLGVGESRRMIAISEPNRVRLSCATFGYQEIAGPRPYLMVPGSLLVTIPTTEWADFLLHPDAFAPRRILAERVVDPDPTWLQVGREGRHWSETLLPELMRESDLEERLLRQLTLLQGHPLVGERSESDATLV